ATLISYLLVFLLRAVNTKKLININISPLQLIVNVALMCGMSYVTVAQQKYNVLISLAVTAVIVLINLPPLLGFLKQTLKSILNKKRKA
ncbi:MAG: hypothetical protein RSA20_08975, partial [Oscillospiraceae bacterium]